MIIILVLINIVLRLIFCFYGYIGTEEGTLLYNQQLAYSGKLPFIDYDAWSSLFHDYLLGWQQFLLPVSILNQRFVGLGLSLIIFWLTYRITVIVNQQRAGIFTALLLTFGSIHYLYFSTIPYSEQFMTLFILIALLFLAPKKSLHPTRQKTLAFIFALSAFLVRSQALPITILVWFYLLIKLKQNLKKMLFISLWGVVFILLTLYPFLIKDPLSLVWAFFWPLRANNILIYQQGANAITLSRLIRFTLEFIRDYGLLAAIILAGIISRLLVFKRRDTFFNLLLLIILSQLVVALVHQPPYASYLLPVVPLLAILGGIVLNRAYIALGNHQIKTFFTSFILLLTGINFVLFPHAQFMKTSLTNIYQTPHSLLKKIADYLKEITPPNTEVLSFYTPIVIEANRAIPYNFNRDRFSLTNLPADQAAKHHLVTREMLEKYIVDKKVAAIILTDNALRVLGSNQKEQQEVINLIEQNYQLTRSFPEINQIEDPKTTQLYIYTR